MEFLENEINRLKEQREMNEQLLEQEKTVVVSKILNDEGEILKDDLTFSGDYFNEVLQKIDADRIQEQVKQAKRNKIKEFFDKLFHIL